MNIHSLAFLKLHTLVPQQSTTTPQKNRVSVFDTSHFFHTFFIVKRNKTSYTHIRILQCPTQSPPIITLS